MNNVEVVELLEVLLQDENENMLEIGCDESFCNILRGNVTLEYAMEYSDIEKVFNNRLNEAYQWVICQFENNNLDFEDDINKLIVETGMGNNTVIDITYDSNVLEIRTGGFTSKSRWSSNETPNKIVEDWNDSLKDQLISRVSELEDTHVIRAMTKKLNKLTY